VIVDETKEHTAGILIPHERVVTLVFWYQHIGGRCNVRIMLFRKMVRVSAELHPKLDFTVNIAHNLRGKLWRTVEGYLSRNASSSWTWISQGHVWPSTFGSITVIRNNQSYPGWDTSQVGRFGTTQIAECDSRTSRLVKLRWADRCAPRITFWLPIVCIVFWQFKGFQGHQILF